MDKARSLHQTLELDVFKENSIGRGFYQHYGFIEKSEYFAQEFDQHVIKLEYQRIDNAK